MVVQATPAPTPRPPKLAPRNFLLASFSTQRWSVAFPADVKYERVFDPEFWAHVAQRIKPNDIIEVHAEDGAFFAELYVRSAHRTGVVVQELRLVPLDGETAPEAVKLTALWKGPVRKWTVMRGKEIVQDGFQTEDEAQTAIVTRAKDFAA
jgi:hypothetical protein